MNLGRTRVVVLFNQSYQLLLTRKIEKIMAAQKNYDSSSLMKSSDSWFNRYEHVAAREGLFQGVKDRFNGISVDSVTENHAFENDSEFESFLLKSLDNWIHEKRRAIWFKVNRSQAQWIPVLARNDFYFHHARDEFVMMYRWLPKDEAMSVPPYASTMVGVGALVINDKNQVLVVSERNALIPNSWKLPGGYCELKENLIDAAIREVEEETNIKTRFESLISARHAHNAAFGCSDLYFIMKLIPETEEIKKCEREIAKSCWMDLDEYLTHPNVHETNRSFVHHWLRLKENGMLIDVVNKTHEILKRQYQIYYPKNIESSES